MTIALFAFIGWLTIIAFFLVPKNLSTEENTIMFFILNITIISIYTALTIDVKLLGPAKSVEAFFALWIQRSIIIPICLLTLMNFLFSSKRKFYKVTASAAVILILTFVDLLTLWTNIKSYTGWTPFLTAATLIILILFYYALTRLLKRIP